MSDSETGNSEFDVFLSYHSSDRESAVLIEKLLSEGGVKVWFDVKSLSPGDLWIRAIESGVMKARNILVVLTDTAPRNWVRVEVELALMRGVQDPGFRIIPLMIQGFYSGAMSPILARFHAFRIPADNAQWGAALVPLAGLLKAPSQAMEAPVSAANPTDLRESISRRADTALAGLSPEETERARRLVLFLVGFVDGRPILRTRSLRDCIEIAGGGKDGYALVERLSSDDISYGAGVFPILAEVHPAAGTEPSIELAHQALLADRTTLGVWLKEDAGVIECRDDGEGAASRWQKSRWFMRVLLAGSTIRAIRGNFIDGTQRARLVVQRSATVNVVLPKAERTLFWSRAVASIIIICLLALGFLGYWNQRPTEAYATDLLLRPGVPKAAFPIEKKVMARRSHGFRLESKGTRLIAIARVGGVLALGALKDPLFQNFPYPDTDKEIAILESGIAPAARWELRYDSKDVLLGFDGFGADGTLLRRARFADNFRRILFLDAFDMPQRIPLTEIVALQLEWNPDGSLAELRYADVFDAPRQSLPGIFGLRFQRGPDGAVTEASFIGADGAVRSAPWGQASAIYGRGTRGDLVDVRFFDAQRHPTFSTARIHHLAAERDEVGNLRRVFTENIENTPWADSLGAVARRFEYDSKGMLKSLVQEGTDGKPCYVRGGTPKIAFEYEQGALQLVSFQDEKGQPVIHPQGAAKIRFMAESNGISKEWTCLGLDGRPTTATSGYSRTTVIRDGVGRITGYRYFGAGGVLTANLDGYAGVDFRYDARGRFLEQSYTDSQGKPTHDSNGATTIRYVYDERGRCARRTFLGTDLKPIAGPDGFATVAWTVSDQGLLLEEMYLDAEDRRLPSRAGFSGMTFGYAAGSSLLVEQAYIGIAGKPISGPRGVAIFRWQHDAEGRAILVEHFDAENQRCAASDGVAAAAFKYDERGRLVEQRYLNTLGQPTLHREGNFGMGFGFDALGYLSESWFLDADGKPMLGRNGFAGSLTRYDPYGRPLEIRQVDVAGHPIVNRDGWAIQRATFGPIIESKDRQWEYFNAAEKRCVWKNGYAIGRHEFDSQGRVISESYFDAYGKPITQRDSRCAKWKRSFDERGWVKETAYFGTNGAPTMHRDGASVVRNINDATGRPVQVDYLDQEGRPTLDRIEKVSSIRYRYDARGNTIEKTHHSSDGSLMLCSHGDAGLRRRYDERNRLIEWIYLELDGRPVLSRDGGAAICRQKYDDRGLITEATNFDTESQPTLDKAGYHRFACEYDERGLETDRSYWGLAGEPAWERNWGVHRRQSTYNDLGNWLETIYRDPKGSLTAISSGLARQTADYDARGFQISECLFGPENKPLMAFGGRCGFIAPKSTIMLPELLSSNLIGRYAAMKVLYDPLGNRLEEKFFGVDGQPLPAEAGAASVRTTFDANGNAEQQTICDTKGQAMNSFLGFARVHWTFDAMRRPVEARFFDAKGAPAQANSKAFIEKYSYDPRGNLTSIVFCDEKGNRANVQRGYAEMKTVFDDRGNSSEYRYIGVDGKSAEATEFGFANSIAVFNPRDNIVEVRKEGADGKLSKGKEGFAIRRDSWDPRDRRIRSEFFDEKNKPCLSSEGYSRRESTYNEMDREIATRFFDPSGAPMMLPSAGAMRLDRKFDPLGQIIEVLRFDVHDQPCPWAKESIHYDFRGLETERSFSDANGHPIVSHLGFAKLTRDYDVIGRQIASKFFDATGKILPAHDLVFSNHWKLAYVLPGSDGLRRVPVVRRTDAPLGDSLLQDGDILLACGDSEALIDPATREVKGADSFRGGKETRVRLLRARGKYHWEMVVDLPAANQGWSIQPAVFIYWE